MNNIFKCECLAINWNITCHNNKLCFECQSCGNKYFRESLRLKLKTGIQELINQKERCGVDKR